MKRREFIALGGAAVSLALLPTQALAADVAPIGIADFGQGDRRHVIRIYPDGAPNAFLLHIRAGRRTFTQRIRLSGDPEGMLQGLLTDGRAEMRVGGQQGQLSTRDGVFQIDGLGQINIVTEPVQTAAGSATSVVVVTLLVAAFAWGVALGSGGGSTSTTSSGGQTEAESEEAEEEEGEGIIASPECDGPPVRLC